MVRIREQLLTVIQQFWKICRDIFVYHLPLFPDFGKFGGKEGIRSFPNPSTAPSLTISCIHAGNITSVSYPCGKIIISLVRRQLFCMQQVRTSCVYVGNAGCYEEQCNSSLSVCTISLCCTFLLSSCFKYNYVLTFSGAHVRSFWRTGMTVAKPLGLSLGFYSREGRFSVLLGHH